jgi:hypothetical protein
MIFYHNDCLYSNYLHERSRCVISMVISEQTEAFLRTATDSADQCRVPVTLDAASERWWTARAVERELGLSEIPIGADLEVLSTRGLLEPRVLATSCVASRPLRSRWPRNA